MGQRMRSWRAVSSDSFLLDSSEKFQQTSCRGVCIIEPGDDEEIRDVNCMFEIIICRYLFWQQLKHAKSIYQSDFTQMACSISATAGEVS